MMFLGTFCIVNFSFCVALSILVVPVGGILARSSYTFLTLLQTLLVVTFSPPVMVLLLSLYLNTDYVGSWATLLTHFREFSTLTYPFLCLAILPQTLTWLYILWKPSTGTAQPN